MAEKNGFMSMIKDGLSYIPQIISSSIFSPIAEGAEMIMNDVEDRVRGIEKRILRKLSSILIIGFGGAFLVFSLFFGLREFFGWSNAAASFFVGIIVFVIGLMLKAWESDR